MRWPQFIGEIMGSDTGGEYEELESLNPFEAKPSLIPDLEMEDIEIETAGIVKCCEKNCLENLPKLRSTEHRSKFLKLQKKEQRLILIGVLINSCNRENNERTSFAHTSTSCDIRAFWPF